PHIASRRPGEEHVQLGHGLLQELEGRDEHVRALDELRLEALAPADAVLLEGADDEAGRRQPERLARSRLRLGGYKREMLEGDPDRNPEDPFGSDARRQSAPLPAL